MILNSRIWFFCLILTATQASGAANCGIYLSSEQSVDLPSQRGKVLIKSELVLFLKHLDKNNHVEHINFADFISIRNAELKVLLETFLGHKVSATTIYRSMPGQIWSNLLIEAGLYNLDRVKKEAKLTSKEITKGLKALHNVRPITQKELRSDGSQETIQILTVAIGRPVTGKHLYAQATNSYDENGKLVKRGDPVQWAKSLETAGIELTDAKLRVRLTEEQVVMALSALIEAGKKKRPQRLTMSALMYDYSPESADLVDQAIGIKMTSARLIGHARRKNTDWSFWKIKIRTYKYKVSVSKNALTDDQIITIISEVHKRFGDKDLNAQEVAKKERKDADQIIKQITGKDIKLKNVAGQAMYRKPWSRWLELAGLDVYKIMKRQIYITDQDIIKIVQALNKHYGPDRISYNQVRHGQFPGVDRVIKIATGKSINMKVVVRQALARQPWSVWLVRSGLEVAKNLDEVTDQEIIESIQALHKEYGDKRLSFQELKTGAFPKADTILRDLTGKRLTLRNLIEIAQNRKPWHEWLGLAGLDVYKIVKRIDKITDQEIIDSVKALHKAFGDERLNFVEIFTGEFEGADEIIKKATGKSFPMRTVLNHARKRKPWSEWLGLAGLDVYKISQTTFDITDDDIVNSIKALHLVFGDEALSSTQVSNGEFLRADQIIKEATGKSIRMKILIRHAKDRRAWFLWLSMAGLDVTKIQLSGKIPFSLVNDITKTSLRDVMTYRDAILGVSSAGFEGTNSDGSSQLVQVDPTNLEDQLIRKEFGDKFSEFKDDLSIREMLLLETFIEQIEIGREFEEILAGTLQAGQITFEKSEIFELVMKIKENPVFIEILSN